MSVGRTVWLGNPPAPRRPRPTEPGWERFWWYFMRISGLALVILAMGHMLIMHVLLQLSGNHLDWAFVNSRWGTPFWRIYDLLLLVLALVHGVNGARVVIGDVVAARSVRSALLIILAVLAVVWMLLGIFVIVAFNPDQSPAVGPFAR